MDTSIEEKISSLPPEKQKKYEGRLMDILHDRAWFRIHNMDYTGPDVLKAKEILFREEYESYLPLSKN